MDTKKAEEDIREEEIREVSPRRDTKTPSRITQKNHLEGLIIGNKSTGVQETIVVSNINNTFITY